jgi:hypothetical protein
VGKYAYKILVKKSKIKRSLWRPGHKSENNINMDLMDMCTGFLYLTIMGSCEYSNELSSSMKGRKFLNQLSDLTPKEGLCM